MAGTTQQSRIAAHPCESGSGLLLERDMSEWILYIVITVGDAKRIDRYPQPSEAACLEAKRKINPVTYNPHGLKPEVKWDVYCEEKR